MNIRQLGLDLIKLSSRFVRIPIRPFEQNVMEDEWDTLIILDACRYDLYNEVVCSYNEDVESRISKGTASGQYMRRNFTSESYHDTVYITANPWALTEIPKNTFFEIRHVWDTHWNDQKGTVMPEDVVSETKDAFAEYSDKRYIVHFMQPHHPFLGPQGQSLGEFDGFRKARDRVVEDDPSEAVHVWDQLKNGRLSGEEVWDAYRENLEYVIPYTKEIAEITGGKTVVTSDHGNLFMERAWPFPFRFTAHPEGVWTPKLVRVPWHILSNGSREVTSENPNNEKELSDGVGNKLKQLGYLE